jgi:hypothetical protein
VITSEAGVTAAHWVSGFTKVNLHPKHRLPLSVWLSKIFAHICAAAGAQADDPLGPAYLRNIQVPPFYTDLRDDDKRQLLALTAPPFDWSAESLTALPAALQKLLLTGDNLYRYYKFHNQRAYAVELGHALPTDLTPAAALARLEADTFASRETTEKRAQFQNLVYIRTIPHLKDAFDSFYGPTGEKTDKHNSSSVQGAIGALLADAVAPSGAGGRATHRLDQFGLPEGTAVIANDPKRLRDLQQDANLHKAMQGHRLTKQATDKEKAAAKKHQQTQRAAKRAKEDVLWALLEEANVVDPAEPFAKRGNVTVLLLKKYLKVMEITQLAPKTGGKPRLVVFFEALCINLVSTFLWFRYFTRSLISQATDQGTVRAAALKASASLHIDAVGAPEVDEEAEDDTEEVDRRAPKHHCVTLARKQEQVNDYSDDPSEPSDSDHSGSAPVRAPRARPPSRPTVSSSSSDDCEDAHASLSDSSIPPPPPEEDPEEPDEPSVPAAPFLLQPPPSSSSSSFSSSSSSSSSSSPSPPPPVPDSKKRKAQPHQKQSKRKKRDEREYFVDISIPVPEPPDKNSMLWLQWRTDQLLSAAALGADEAKLRKQAAREQLKHVVTAPRATRQRKPFDRGPGLAGKLHLA